MNSYNEKTNYPIQTWAKDFNRHVFRGDTHMVSEHETTLGIVSH